MSKASQCLSNIKRLTISSLHLPVEEYENVIKLANTQNDYNVFSSIFDDGVIVIACLFNDYNDEFKRDFPILYNILMVTYELYHVQEIEFSASEVEVDDFKIFPR